MARHPTPFGSIAFAWLAVLAVAFAAGFVYPVILTGQAPLDPDGIFFCFLIGMTFVFIAAPVAALVGFAIGTPLFRAAIQRHPQSPVVFLAAGLLLSLVAATLVGAVHAGWEFLSESEFKYAALTIGIAGPVAGWTVWKHTRTASSNNAWSGRDV